LRLAFPLQNFLFGGEGRGLTTTAGKKKRKFCAAGTPITTVYDIDNLSARIGIVQLLAFYSDHTHRTIPHVLLVFSGSVCACRVTDRPHFDCDSLVRMLQLLQGSISAGQDQL
jgi:hypothetical protein